MRSRCTQRGYTSSRLTDKRFNPKYPTGFRGGRVIGVERSIQRKMWNINAETVLILAPHVFVYYIYK